MAKTIRASLSGYNALTDTNPNHYALYVDNNDVLIKEKVRGTKSVGASSSASVSHGLSYVPLCFVFVQHSSGTYRRVDGNAFDSSYSFEVDNTNLTFYNSTSTTKTFYYYIFYDNVTSGTPSFTRTGYVLAASKSGYNVLTDNNPNHYIFHSNLNTFKLVVSGTKSISLSAYTYDQTFTQSHGLSFTPFINAFATESGTGRVFGVNSDDIYFWGPKSGLWETGTRFNYVQSNSTNIVFNFDNDDSAKTVIVRYYCLEKI